MLGQASWRGWKVDCPTPRRAGWMKTRAALGRFRCRDRLRRGACQRRLRFVCLKVGHHGADKAAAVHAVGRGDAVETLPFLRRHTHLQPFAARAAGAFCFVRRTHGCFCFLPMLSYTASREYTRSPRIRQYVNTPIRQLLLLGRVDSTAWVDPLCHTNLWQICGAPRLIGCGGLLVYNKKSASHWFDWTDLCHVV